MQSYVLKDVILVLTGIALISLSALTTPKSTSTIGPPVDNRIYNQLLKKYVNEKGQVNYKGLKGDEKELKKYLDHISANPPTDKWSKNEQMAYWINAYNAYTIQLILSHYPVSSIKDIGSKIKIPFVTTPWASKFFKIGGEAKSLDNIENGMLRKKFDEPRIHFALVRAARSSPRLRNEAYEASKLIAQLDDQGTDFLNNPAKNAVTFRQASLSKSFDWYKRDWQADNKSIDFWVNRYSMTKISPNTPISFLAYNWALNEQ